MFTSGRYISAPGVLDVDVSHKDVSHMDVSHMVILDMDVSHLDVSHPGRFGLGVFI